MESVFTMPCSHCAFCKFHTPLTTFGWSLESDRDTKADWHGSYDDLQPHALSSLARAVRKSCGWLSPRQLCVRNLPVHSGGLSLRGLFVESPSHRLKLARLPEQFWCLQGLGDLTVPERGRKNASFGRKYIVTELNHRRPRAGVALWLVFSLPSLPAQ